MHEDKYGPRIDQLQEAINILRKDLEGFKKEQKERFESSLLTLERSVALYIKRQNNLSAKFWISVTINLFSVFVLAVCLIYGR